MSFADTIAADFGMTAADWGETVTYKQGGTIVSGLTAVVLELSRREVQSSDGFFDGSERVFLLPSSALGLTPAASDTITRGDSTSWSVVDVRGESADKQWRLVGKQHR